MSDYTPVYVPGRVITLTASTAVSGGDLLAVSGSGTVAKAAIPGANTPPPAIVGVAADDTVANGRVTVYGRGTVHESVANGTITAGDMITATPNGGTAGSQVSTLPALAAAATPVGSDVDAARVIVGIALTTATNPAKVRWMEC